MLAAADHLFDPTFPGLFAGDPPAEFVPLLEEMAAAVRPGSMRTALLVMAEADQRDLLPRIAVPTLLIWGSWNRIEAQAAAPLEPRGAPAKDDQPQRRAAARWLLLRLRLRACPRPRKHRSRGCCKTATWSPRRTSCFRRRGSLRR